jgi:hypothetical protein
VLVAASTALLAACTGGSRGIHVINATQVPIAIGYSHAVPPCSERFISEAELNDMDRGQAPAAWTTTDVWVPAEDVDVFWLLVAAGGTSASLTAPAVVPDCRGEPLGWTP